MTLAECGQSEGNLIEAKEIAQRLLEPDSLGILSRKPLMDDELPEVSDIDLLAIWDKPEEYVERRTVMGSEGRVFVDIMWIPVGAMLDSRTAAGYRMLPHLLLESDEVWMKSDAVRRIVNRVRLNAYDRSIWERRVGSQISFGDAAFREVSRNLDFPPASLFYLQMAHAYYLTALADSTRQSIMSIMTRPMARLRKIDSLLGCDLENRLMKNLLLNSDPSDTLVSLRKLHDAVSSRCRNQTILNVAERTRSHYLYSVSPVELEYRESVAHALIRRGDLPAAHFYLRFWAYSLVRCPIVLEEAREGKRPSLYVPFRPLKESLERSFPEGIDIFTRITGNAITRADVEESVRGTAAFREIIVDIINKNGLHLATCPDGGSAAKKVG
jgi:hypothetical protein